jgi:POT family proton-dependent oligopeptide transporter
VDVQRDDRFPPGIPYIVGNEGAERFSYYGMRQILYVYLTSLFIGFAAETAVSSGDLASAKVRATQITHLFMAGVYLFPMIGAILADRWLGKYRVILGVSFIYCAGHAALALAGRAGVLGNLGVAEAAMLAGLTLIALGSGGIKPCVSANVGDQFSAKNGHLITRVFQIFYFMINFGSFFASLMTPYLYKNYGPEVAFGVPGVLMAVATVVFWMGRHRFVRVPPKPGGRLGALDFVASSLMATPILILVAVGAGVAEEVVDAVMKKGIGALGGALAHLASTHWLHALGALVGFAAGYALFRVRQGLQEDSGFLSVLMYSLRHRAERKSGEDFWGPARRHFGDEAAEGPPAVLRIIVVFSMVSVFWALFDQHASTWVEQAKAMNLTLVVPKSVWFGWLMPATVSGAAFGAVWLFAWVSNRALSRRVTSGVIGLIGLWGAGSVAAHFLHPQEVRVDLLPAQISALNPLFVMLVIPLLNLLVYQPLERRGRPLRPLQRMGIGMCLTSLSFVAVALIQMRIQVQGPGTVHVLWQIIPYLVVTTAEVLVSVTGLEFAYTQAPRTMKSTIAGFWLLCVTFGNVLVAFLAPLQKLSLSTFFWLFAVLMAVAAVAFLFLASRYRGKSYLQPGA